MTKLNLSKLNRQTRIQEANQGKFDLIVIGGGIHGACIARDAVLRGYRTLLLEAEDYAFGTSSRSSKLLHGGLRYLEQGNISLVREALAERALVIKQAGHLAQAQNFLFPIISGKTRPAWQISLGLRTYDLLANLFNKLSREESAELFKPYSRLDLSSNQALNLKAIGLEFAALYCYSDAQMDDARLVIENIVDASQLGAVTLNYAQLTNFKNCGSSKVPNWQTSWRCQLSAEEHHSQSRFIINAAGPWVPKIHQSSLSWSQNWPKPVYSRGVHLWFNQPWNNSGVFLPTSTKGRNYWILPYFCPRGAYTLVGTTDRKVSDNENNPQAASDEINELLSYLRQDVPRSGLDDKSLYTTTCGMRILAQKGEKDLLKNKVSAISREEVWLEEPGYLALLGGKFTTARATAEKAINKFERYLGQSTIRDEPSKSTRTRKLPGGDGWSESVKDSLKEELKTFLLKQGYTVKPDQKPDREKCEQEIDALAEAAVNRFGVRSRQLFTDNLYSSAQIKNLAISALRSEIRLAIIEEQAMTTEDILRRRLGLSLLPDGGKNIESIIEEELKALS